jgi:hypothetical protein
MARHRKIDVRMWGDEKFQSLSGPPPNGQSLFIYLLANPAITSVPGLYKAGRAQLADELGWELKGFDEAFAEVSAKGLAKADWKARLVWVPGAPKYNTPENPNVVIGWRVHLDELPECSLKIEALRALVRFCQSLGEPFAKAFAKACPKGLANQEQEQEQEPEQEQEQESQMNASLRSAFAPSPYQEETPEPSKDSETEELSPEEQKVPQSSTAGRPGFGGGLDKPLKRNPSTFGVGQAPGGNGHSNGYGPRGPSRAPAPERAHAHTPAGAPQAPAGGEADADSAEASSEEPEPVGAALEADTEARVAKVQDVIDQASVAAATARLRKSRTRQFSSHAVDERPPEKPKRVTKGKIAPEIMLKVRALEEQWRTQMGTAFPELVVATWGGKECAQTAQLLEKYGFGITGLSFDYVVMNWEVIRAKWLKGSGGVPSVGFLLARHEVLAAEAQQWTKIRDFQVEYRAWRQDNRLAMVLPQALEAQRKVLQPTAKALGISL